MAKKACIINLDGNYSYTHDMKKFNGNIDITYGGTSDLANNLEKVYVSGSTLYMQVSGDPKLHKFKNIKGNINIKFHKGDNTVVVEKTLEDFYYAYSTVDFTPDKKRNIKGTLFSDNINLSNAETYPVANGKGYNVTAGAGNDYVSGTAGKDTISGGAGADTLFGGLGNDSILGGSGEDVFVFNKNDGADLITDTALGDEIEIRNEDIDLPVTAETLKYKKNGNNLEIYYTGEVQEDGRVNLDNTNKIVVKNHFKTAADKRIDFLEVTYTNEDIEPQEISLKDQEIIVEGKKTIKATSQKDKIFGSASADTIKAYAGDDVINSYEGNDKIYGGAGNDTINAGAGKNTIYYSLGDGDDTILYGGENAHDTIVFDKGIKVTSSLEGDDLKITYSGKKGKTNYENTITVKDYKNNSSVEKIKVGTKTKSAESYQKGGTYYSTEESEYWASNWKPEWEEAGAKLTQGNHTFVYDYDYTHGENWFGGDFIWSPNTAKSGYVDTIQLNEQTIGRSFEIYYSKGIDNQTGEVIKETDILLWHNNGISNIDYDMSNGQKLNIKDAERTYIVSAYDNNSATINNNTGTFATQNNLTLVTGEENSNTTYTIASNDKYNYTSAHRSAVNYTYNGGHDKVQTDEYAYTNDTYNVSSFSTNTFFKVYEGGGTNDVINFNYANATADDIRLIFDVTQFGDNIIGSRNNIRTFFAHKDALADNEATLAKIIASDDQANTTDSIIEGTAFVLDLPQAQEFPSGIETIQINGTAINAQAWYDAVQSRLGQILRYEKTENNHGYVTVVSCVTGEGQVSDEQKLNIINAYRTLKYSDIVQATVTTGNAVALAGDKFNRYTFEGNYNGATITSANTLYNGFSDTLIFTDSSFKEGTLSLGLADAGEGKKDLVIKSGDKTVTYKNYLTGNNADIILVDKDNKKVSVSEYSNTNLLSKQFSFGDSGSEGTNNAVFINDDGSHGYNNDVDFYMGGKSQNHVYVEGGIKLNVSQSGAECFSNVISASNTNDEYYFALPTSAQVNDMGGNNDKIKFRMGDNSNMDNLAAVCNVYKKYDELHENWQWAADRDHVVFSEKTSVTENTLIGSTSENLIRTTGINVKGEMENVEVNTQSIDEGAWFNAIAQSVGAWLNTTTYDSVAEAVNAYNNDNSIDLSGLIAKYQDVNVSNYLS